MKYFIFLLFVFLVFGVTTEESSLKIPPFKASSRQIKYDPPNAFFIQDVKLNNVTAVANYSSLVPNDVKWVQIMAVFASNANRDTQGWFWVKISNSGYTHYNLLNAQSIFS